MKRSGPTILRHLEAYLAHKGLYGWRGRALSDGRMADIERTLRLFACTLPRLAYKNRACRTTDDMDLESMRPEAVRAWQQDRLQQVCAGTVNKDLRILRGFARWMIQEGHWQADALCVRWLYVQDLPHVRKQPKPLDHGGLQDELRRLPLHVRLPILGVFVFGDRPGAICACLWGDVYTDERGHGYVQLRQRKGGKPKSIPFTAGDLVDKYLGKARVLFQKTMGRPPWARDRLFISKRRNPWTVQVLDNAVRYYHTRRRKKKGFKPYQLRHTLGTLAALSNASATQIQALLGHERRAMSEAYTHLSGQDVKDTRERTAKVWGGAVKALLE